MNALNSAKTWQEDLKTLLQLTNVKTLYTLGPPVLSLEKWRQFLQGRKKLYLFPIESLRTTKERRLHLQCFD